MNKKILFVRTVPYDFNPNTYNVQPYGLGKAFCNMGYDYDFICFNKRSQNIWTFYEHNGHKARCIEKKRIRWFRMGINIEITNRAFLDSYDLIITTEYDQIESYLLSRHSNKVVLYNGPYYNMFCLKYMSFVYDLFFTKTFNEQLKHKFAKSELAKRFLESKGYNDITTIGVGLDTERFDDNIHMTLETKVIVDYMKSNRCILYVGALSERKNFPFMLKIFQKVKAKYDDVKFVIIGKSKQSTIAKLIGKQDDSYAASYMGQLSADVKKSIFYVEKIDNSQLKFIYPLAKAFLLPSKLEIFGMVLLEAMYLKAPVISSRNGGSVTLIENRKTGQIVSEFDVIKWTDAVFRYLDNPEYSIQTVNAAHELIVTEFRWEAIARKMLKTLNML